MPIVSQLHRLILFLGSAKTVLRMEDGLAFGRGV
jgi:hypothetical protein